MADDRLRTPKGWTGPKFVDGKPVEGTWRAHQVPIADLARPEHVRLLEEWMQSYGPTSCSTSTARFREELAALAPTGHRRMGANPHANGGILLEPCRCHDFRDYAVNVPAPGGGGRSHAHHGTISARRDEAELGKRNFRVFGPDETASNRLDAVYEATGRHGWPRFRRTRRSTGPDGRVMEV